MGVFDGWNRRRKEVSDRDEGPRGTQGLGIAGIVGGAVILLAVLFALLILMGARPLAAQGLADFDYENLGFRGASLDAGYIMPSRVESTSSFGGRVDLGFLGPGVRVTAGFSRWSSFLKAGEVRTLEERLEELIREQSDDPNLNPSVDLGDISWSDVALNLDAHVVWRVPFGVLTYLGLGGSTHVLRGGGAAIEDTFVEDLLDSIRAGFNLHGGLEIPVHRHFRLLGEARYEALQGLSYGQVRVGGQVMFGGGNGGTGPR
jgi:hypothetical protein